MNTVFNSATEGHSLQQQLLHFNPKTSVWWAAEDEEEKVLQLLGGILLKLQAFCEKTRNAHKELKDSVLTAVNAFKKVNAAHGRRLTL